MLFNPTIHPCDNRKQRDFAAHTTRALANVDFDDQERLGLSLRKMAELAGLPDVTVVPDGGSIAVAHAGRTITTWTPAS